MAFGFTWEDQGKRRTQRAHVVLFAALLAAVPATPVVAAAARFAGQTISVIVRGGSPQDVSSAASDVRAAGGHVVRTLGIVDGVEATVPADATGWLAAQPGIIEVSPNAPLHMYSTGYDPTGDVGSWYDTARISGANAFWSAGYTGQGVDVALIDSGVAPVNGLTAPGKVINGPDLSFESQVPNLQYLDTFGHGTHLAGIIAGRDDSVTGGYTNDTSDFIGMAPDARIVSIKVADANGNSDVSQVIAAIDWVVQHKSDPGMNIRVLNLSFGTDSAQSYQLDPLAFAAEVAWRSGIVVVVSAGNQGATTSGLLADPAVDPFVIAVGAADTENTVSRDDDQVAIFSQRSRVRHPDLVAPGVHIVSLRDPNSYIDQTYGGTGLVGSRFFRGSGTSQAAAVVSGAAALLLSQRPNMNPDQVKALLDNSARNLDNIPTSAQGNGELSLRNALNSWTPSVGSSNQQWTPSNGTGSLELSRGSIHVVINGVPLVGEQGIMGMPFNSAAMASLEAAGQSWSGGTWNGQTWSGAGWTGQSWSSQTWSGAAWTGQTWSGQTWSSQTWSGQSWSSQTWSGQSWSSQTWSGQTWSSAVWNGQTWSGQTWSGQTWSGQSWSNSDWS